MQQPGATGGVPPLDQQGGQQQQYQQQQPPPPQQWMMMPPQQQAAVVAGVQPPSGWAPQAGPPPPSSQAQPYGAAVPNSGSDEIRSLWIGDLQQWMDENYILNCFAHTGEVKDIILFGFVENL